MAADYDKLGLDANLYRKDSSQQRLTAADLEVMFSDSELLSSKIGSVSTGRIIGGVLGPNESIIVSDGKYRRGIFGFVREEV